MLKLKGKRFGKLLVEDFAYTKGKGTWWLCKCDCGSPPRILLGCRITSGETRSCGCLRRAVKSEIPYYWIYRILLKVVSESRYHDFKIDLMSFDDFLTFTEIDKCHYCNEKINWDKFTTYKDKFVGNTRSRNMNRKYNLDRKDNMKGYIKENCVVCCSLCNYIKGRFLTYNEMCLLGKSVSAIYDLRRVHNKAVSKELFPSDTA